MKRYDFTFLQVQRRHVTPVEQKLGYKLLVPLLEMGRRVFMEAVQSLPTDLPELEYDYSAGWISWYESPPD